MIHFILFYSKPSLLVRYTFDLTLIFFGTSVFFFNLPYEENEENE